MSLLLRKAENVPKQKSLLLDRKITDSATFCRQLRNQPAYNRTQPLNPNSTLRTNAPSTKAPLLARLIAAPACRAPPAPSRPVSARAPLSHAHYPGGAMVGRRASRLAPYRHYTRMAVCAVVRCRASIARSRRHAPRSCPVAARTAPAP